jgi:hypothetical protein
MSSSREFGRAIAANLTTDVIRTTVLFLLGVVIVTGSYLGWALWLRAFGGGIILTLVVVMVPAYITASRQRRREEERKKGPFLRGQLMLGSGSGLNISSITLNGKALHDFRKDFNVAVVCGLEDPECDKFEDTRISKSNAFTIVAQPMEILIPHQAPMTDVFAATVAKAIAADADKPGFRTKPGKKKGRKLLVPYRQQTWTETILLPKNRQAADIHKLSDVRRFGGKILSEEMHEKRITPTLEDP